MDKLNKELDKFIKDYNVKDSKEKIIFCLERLGFYIQEKPTIAYIDIDYLKEKGIL
ncbi:hypothetical protein [Lactobacillus mulieris]|uniref:hypothetical protein n=1 Tax=Lactobacillus mulieris TaxID=2508708 RepID=UPI0001B2B201|nr:hypothetical protein [Lactobacillus mulieris]EEU21625.1 hypothetical protein HMPREF0525_00559 [Lactobacillus jensenii 27-2-CHN]EEX24495.1 hypothetical protein HMPREF0974_00300 [Lactobacillus jensenii 115-3-CHN]MCW8093520.1 hypothetical protein [Lactobacillus mulieris]MCZ3875623.1 hypothetical protein [Lactobacillus mulieris]MCZ3899144.1 hypothetical protein [Lactobacillus mulieris]